MSSSKPQSLLFAIAALACAPSPQAAESWTQFRGPTAQGYADASNAPLRWSETEHVKWKTPLPGEGWSSPVVADGQVWLTTALEEGKSLHAICVDFATGKVLRDVEVFRNEVVPAKHRRNSYASPTPILDGDRVYVHFGTMGTAALSTKDGSKLWENRALQTDHQNGPGGSPTLYKDKLLIAFDGIDTQYEVALDTRTGKVVWKTERSAIPKLMQRPSDMRKAYGTPLILQIDGRAQSLTTAAERLYAYDPESGQELWFVDYPGFSNVPLPVANAEMAFVCTGFNKPEIWGIRIAGAKKEVSATNVVWKQKAGVPDQTSPLLIGNRLYIVSSGGIASCLNAETGEIVWKERIGSDFAASPIFASGRIYFFDCNGKSLVIEPGDTFKRVGENQLSEGFMASPAVVGNTFILRTKAALYRIE